MKRKRVGHEDKLKLGHHLLRDLRPTLESLALEPKVRAINPGRISHVGVTIKGLRLRATCDTPNGVKIMARSEAAIQEVFVVGDRAFIRQWVARQGALV